MPRLPNHAARRRVAVLVVNLKRKLGGIANWVINADRSIDAEWVGTMDSVESLDENGEYTLVKLLDTIELVTGGTRAAESIDASISIVPRYHGVGDAELTYRYFRGAIDLATYYWSIIRYPLAVLTAEKIMETVRKNQEADPFEIAVRFFWSPRGIYRERNFGAKKKIRPV